MKPTVENIGDLSEATKLLREESMKMIKAMGAKKRQDIFEGAVALMAEQTVKNIMAAGTGQMPEYVGQVTNGFEGVNVMLKVLTDRIRKLDPTFTKEQYQIDLTYATIDLAFKEGIDLEKLFNLLTGE